MSDNQVTLYPRTCGNCGYAVVDQEARKHNVAEAQYLCHYYPPKANMIPIQSAGGMGMSCVAGRPPVKEDDVACNFYKPRERVQ